MTGPAAAIRIRDASMARHPEFPWLSLDAPERVGAFLRQQGWLEEDEQLLRCEKPGEGNMNLTIRVVTDRRSWIVKQARPWVEKYDQIPAPWDRIEYECRFYQRTSDIPGVAERMPRLLFADMAARLLVMSDLGDAQPLTSLYGGDNISPAEIRELAEYLCSLHGATCGRADPSFENPDMRRLNHEHLFEVPVADNNPVDITQWGPEMSAMATRLRHDADYRGHLDATGRRYLGCGPVLLHGDYFPGSWLRTGAGVFMVDPEFCFYGDAEFDLGCALAHLALARQPRERAELFVQAYHAGRGEVTLDSALLARYAAAEVMRRLIGVAQLPLEIGGSQRAALLESSWRVMIQPAWEGLWE